MKRAGISESLAGNGLHSVSVRGNLKRKLDGFKMFNCRHNHLIRIFSLRCLINKLKKKEIFMNFEKRFVFTLLLVAFIVLFAVVAQADEPVKVTKAQLITLIGSELGVVYRPEDN
jgi:hypothetical protein